MDIEGPGDFADGVSFFNEMASESAPIRPQFGRAPEGNAVLEDVHQLVEGGALFGSLSRGGRLDEIVDAEVVFAWVLVDGEALAAQVLLRGRDPQIGNVFHGLTMEYGFWYFI